MPSAKRPTEPDWPQLLLQKPELSLEHINDVAELSALYLPSDAVEFSEQDLHSDLYSLWKLSQAPKPEGRMSHQHAKKVLRIVSAAFSYFNRLNRPSQDDGFGDGVAQGSKPESKTRIAIRCFSEKLDNKLGGIAARNYSPISKERKHKYVGILQEMSLPSNSENFFTLRLLESAFKENKWHCDFSNFLLAGRNAIQSSRELEDASERIIHALKCLDKYENPGPSASRERLKMLSQVIKDWSGQIHDKNSLWDGISLLGNISFSDKIKPEELGEFVRLMAKARGSGFQSGIHHVWSDCDSLGRVPGPMALMREILADKSLYPFLNDAYFHSNAEIYNLAREFGLNRPERFPSFLHMLASFDKKEIINIRDKLRKLPDSWAELVKTLAGYSSQSFIGVILAKSTIDKGYGERNPLEAECRDFFASGRTQAVFAANPSQEFAEIATRHLSRAKWQKDWCESFLEISESKQFSRLISEFGAPAGNAILQKALTGAKFEEKPDGQKAVAFLSRFLQPRVVSTMVLLPSNEARLGAAWAFLRLDDAELLQAATAISGKTLSRAISAYSDKSHPAGSVQRQLANAAVSISMKGPQSAKNFSRFLLMPETKSLLSSHEQHAGEIATNLFHLFPVIPKGTLAVLENVMAGMGPVAANIFSLVPDAAHDFSMDVLEVRNKDIISAAAAFELPKAKECLAAIRQKQGQNSDYLGHVYAKAASVALYASPEAALAVLELAATSAEQRNLDNFANIAREGRNGGPVIAAVAADSMYSAEFGNKIVSSLVATAKKNDPGYSYDLKWDARTVEKLNAAFGVLAQEKIASALELLLKNTKSANQGEAWQSIVTGIADGAIRQGEAFESKPLAEVCKWVGENYASAKEIKETGFFFQDDGLFPRIFSASKTAALISQAGFQPVIAFGLMGLGASWSPEQVAMLRRLLPPGGEVSKEKYVRPVFISFIKERPELQSGLISSCLGMKASNWDDSNLLALMSFAHCMGPEIPSAVAQQKPDSIAKAVEIGRATALSLLSSVYSKEALEGMPQQDMIRWLSVFPEFEQTMKIHHDEDLIPSLRLLSTLELLGKEKEFWAHDENLRLYLAENLEKLFPVEGERVAISEYISKWSSMEDEKKIFGAKTREEILQTLGQWRSPIKLEHTLSETSVMDRLMDVRRRLDDVFYKEHFSGEFIRIAGLYEGASTIGQLAGLYRDRKGEGAGRQELESIKLQQESVRRWSKLQSIFLNYGEKFDSLEEGVLSAGRELAPYADLIARWGFDYGDSFGNKVFRGELSLLSLRCKSALAASPNDKRLADLGQKIRALENACATSNDYALSVADALSPADASKQGIIAGLQRKKAWAEGVLLPLEQGELPLEQALSKTRAEQPDFHSMLLSSREKPINRQELADALRRYTEATAIVDLETIVDVARATSSEKDMVFVYSAQPTYSRMELAMVGQCLDYRYSKNSIGNAPFTVSYMDSWRQLVVAYSAGDEKMEQPRVNGLVFLASVKLDGSHDAGPAIVLDRIYASDKTELGWSKIEGHVRFALEKASQTGLPLVLPDFLSPYYVQIREWASDTGFGVREAEAVVLVQPGPSGATYCELADYVHSSADIELKVNSLVLSRK